KGFLIDLDLAKILFTIATSSTAANTSPSLRRRTGTMLFIAIEILAGTCPRHSYRHDLESLLCVLIW
ncbi:hypothetical protein EV426DRAFT_505077, partial [Tirmania nivea]